MKTTMIKLYKDENGKTPYLTTILKEIPTDTILCKTLTGLGATYEEIKAKRHSIIIEPNVSTIQSKLSDSKHTKDNLFGVIENVGIDDIKEYILDSKSKCYKLLVTPESFIKVKKAFEDLNMHMHDECFMLFDECHKLIKDADYRENIHLPLDDFFQFKDKALVSATPVELSDPRFNNFQKLVIEPQFPYSKDIYIQYTNNTLERFKTTIKELKNDCICIFLNSTDTIHAIMDKTGILEESTVFCAPKSVYKLKHSLNFKNAYSKFESKQMKKYNFFTSRFYAGMDIELNYKPDLIMLSDVNLVEHTILDPYTDIIQIIGRFRHGVNYITHITNSFTDYPYRSKEEVLREIGVYETCYKFIRRELGNAIDNGAQYAFRKLLETSPFNKFLDINKKKVYCTVDNYVNDIMTRNLYLNKENILYKIYNDEILMKYFNAFTAFYPYKAGDAEWLQLRNANKSIISKRKAIVDILEKILPYETESDYEFREEIRKADPLIVEAVDALGIAEVRKLRYITNSLKLAIYKVNSTSPQVTELIHDHFEVNKRYLLTYIKQTIIQIYNECGIKSPERVTAQTLYKYFNCRPCNIKKKEGLLIVSELI